MAIHTLIKFLAVLFLINEVGATLVNVTLLYKAAEWGAVCLDGSPGGVGVERGYGTGAKKWVVFLEGGGWCESTKDCIARAAGRSYAPGSTLNRSTVYLGGGILDSNQSFNPDFYNWNKAFVLYCDGASFMADIEEIDPATNLTFRGARIFDAVMADLLDRGMWHAGEAILSGGSAGGLAAILHCDKFRSLISPTARVKCLSDSGFFIHGSNLPGADFREHRFARVTQVHGLSERLPTSCTSRLRPGLAYQCLFPENLVDDVQTPLFLLESAFDSFQISENYLRAVGNTNEWKNCTSDVALCTCDQIKLMQDFRNAFLETLQALQGCPSRGLFVHSCHRHGHLSYSNGWRCSFVVGYNTLANKSIGEAFGDWYFDRAPFQVIDTHNDVPRECTASPPDFDRKCLTCRSN